MESDDVKNTLSINPTVRMLLSVAIAVLVLIVTAVCILIVFGNGKNGPGGTLTDSPTFTPPPTFTPRSLRPTSTPIPSPTPIYVGWHELGNLTVVGFTGRTVAELKGKETILGTERLLLEVTGTVKVGVDMLQITDTDVIVEGTQVTVTLPQPAIESVDIPEGQWNILLKEKWVVFSDLPKDYQLQALDIAKRQLHDWIANDEAWMDIARILAQRRLTVFLEQLGFEDIEILFRENTRSG